jgi:nickel transport protein
MAWTLLVSPDAARAHRVYLFAWDEGDRVCSESYYSKASRIADAELTVRDTDGKELLRGRGNHEGYFCFVRPSAAELVLSVDAGQGHRGEFRLSAKTPVSSARSGHSAKPDAARFAAAPAEHEEPGLREILGGLGWIAGLAALLAWYRKRHAP